MRWAIFFLLILTINFTYAECSSTQININTASLSDLDKLDGIGAVKAQAIIDTRPFSSVDDLNKVKGIGDVILQKIKTQGLACVSGSSVSQNTDNENQELDIEPIEKENTSRVEEEPFSDSNTITANLIEDTPSIIDTPQSENIINLNSDIDIAKEEIIYESKNEIIKKYAMYAFAFFLVFIIIILLIKR
jgi:competence ComEA-like helix-hairpin-helix protein